MTNRYNDGSQYVKAEHSPIVSYQQVLSQADSEAVTALQNPGQAAMSISGVQTPHHSPTEHAEAALMYSKAYVGFMVLIVSAIVGMAYMIDVFDGDLFLYAVTWLGGLGIAGFVSLTANRKQGLYHSQTGVQHHELEIRADIAKHSIDTHADLLRSKWGLEDHE